MEALSKTDLSAINFYWKFLQFIPENVKLGLAAKLTTSVFGRYHNRRTRKKARLINDIKMAESKHTTTEELNGLQTNYPKVPTVKDFLRVIKNPEVRAMLLSPPK